MPLPGLLSDTYRPALEQALTAVFTEYEQELLDISPDGERVLALLKEFSLRPSKRIRGSLAAAMYDHATGAEVSEAALRLGACVELLQNYLLIIDDVMDRSDIRRGKPSLHRLYESLYPDTGEHEAYMAGVLIGMFAQHSANIALLGGNYDPTRLRAALALLHTHMTITDIGQIDDMRQQISHLPITGDALRRKYQQKSSYYSFVNPLQMALVLAGKDEMAARRDAEAFGLPAGVAFQLRDDYLGIFGESSTTGKPNLDDIREGKYTFMIHYALEQASIEERESLLAILGSPTADEHALEAVRKIICSTGADERAMVDAERYIQEAKQAALAGTSWDESFARMLNALVDFIVERQV
ncbi:Geranylgeranyl pyrophosphate synthase [Candidatus Saccharibacteria bacterium RAAC3_TM7_1]|nr:Geranylgeranyl pyrophosphate synthase [Candidatus Saccharibacteria bacterium RAAC3_TM7_1]HCZ28439.1 polyprenyl synthetase family protein [Candidatus Saccharibacteria bacterium]